MAALGMVEIAKAARKREQHREGVLGDRSRVGAARVRQDDVGVDQLRDFSHELDSGARRLNPAKILCCQVFFTRRKAEERVSVGNLAEGVFVARRSEKSDVRVRRSEGLKAPVAWPRSENNLQVDSSIVNT